MAYIGYSFKAKWWAEAFFNDVVLRFRNRSTKIDQVVAMTVRREWPSSSQKFSKGTTSKTMDKKENSGKRVEWEDKKTIRRERERMEERGLKLWCDVTWRSERAEEQLRGEEGQRWTERSQKNPRGRRERSEEKVWMREIDTAHMFQSIASYWVSLDGLFFLDGR